MRNASSTENNAGKVDAFLYGGCADFPENLRAQRVEVGQRTVKVIHANGYEHFERVDDEAPESPVSFRWTMRTRIAE
jgi:hypothetical protein